MNHTSSFQSKLPLIMFGISLVIYTMFAQLNRDIFESTENAYFNYLADAFIHKQLNLRIIPANTHDLILFDNLYYLYWLPLPAILLIPFIYLWGINFSDIIFNIFIASLNVALTAILLNSYNHRFKLWLNDSRIVLLTLFFAFGTVHFPIAVVGKVWFTGQLITYCFSCLAYIYVLRKPILFNSLLSGIFISLAILTRANIIPLIIWPFVYVYRYVDNSKKFLFLSTFTLPILTSLIIIGIYNHARFDNFLDFGLDYHQMHQIYFHEYKTYGAFDPYYIPLNFYYQLVQYPFPLNQRSLYGGSLFLLSPLFLAIFWVNYRQRCNGLSPMILLVTIILSYIPIVLLMGTGWIQFGPRYTLDFTIPLLLLTLIGIKKWSFIVLVLTLSISFAHFLLGTLYFMQYV